MTNINPSTKNGLAGYVRNGPPVGSLLAAVFLFPFWLSSEIAQARWKEVVKALALMSVWALLLGGIGYASVRTREPRDEQVIVQPSPSIDARPTTGSMPSPSVTATLTPPVPTAQATTSASAPNVTLGLIVEPEPLRMGYDRDLFRHWIDADHDGCDTRREVLIAESLDPVTVGPDCSLSGGRWYSAYDGVTLTDASRIDIDHFIPLAEAWDSGASSWSASRRAAFANDLGAAGSLIAVSSSSNRSKSDQDPAEWQPLVASYRCEYAKTWAAVKKRWKLTADATELAAVRAMLNTCR